MISTEELCLLIEQCNAEINLRPYQTDTPLLKEVDRIRVALAVLRHELRRRIVEAAASIE